MLRPALGVFSGLLIFGVAAYGANQQPTVSITMPASGLTVVGPTTIQLEASASSPDSTIKSVTYSVNGTTKATVSVAPYKYNWTKVPAGSYAITAVAKDALGLTSAPSAAVNATVLLDQAPTVTMTVMPHTGFTNIGPETLDLAANPSSTDPAEGGNIIAVVHQTNTLAHYGDFILYEAGYPVNSSIASQYLKDNGQRDPCAN